MVQTRENQYMLVMVDRPGWNCLEKDCWWLTFRRPQRRSPSEPTLKMTTAEAFKTSVTNSLSQDYSNLDDLPSPTCIGISSCLWLLSVPLSLFLVFVARVQLRRSRQTADLLGLKSLEPAIAKLIQGSAKLRLLLFYPVMHCLFSSVHFTLFCLPTSNGSSFLSLHNEPHLVLNANS